MGRRGSRLNLSVVGWAADSGVGRELIEAARHLPVSSAFILSNPTKPTRRDLVTIPCFMSSGTALVVEMKAFIDKHKPDTILTWEVPGSWDFPALWASKGIRWVHMVHWDWFARDRKSIWKRAELLAPNRMCQAALKEQCLLESTLLPVPVDTDRFAFKLRKKADHFVSIYAYGGSHERRSLMEIFDAWGGLEKPPPLTIFAQKKPPELDELKPVPGIEVLLGNAPDPWMLYETGDVSVQMSRYEGVGVSLLEAQSCGLPVVSINAPPMDEITPDLSVAIRKMVAIEIMGKELTSYIPSVESLRERIASIQGQDIKELSLKARERVEKDYSWKVLRPRWMEVLEGAAS